MPLDPAKVEKVKPSGDGGWVGRCPVCSADGGDHLGQHLRQFPDGAFACVANPGDREHRRAVWAVAGDRSAGRPLPVAPRTIFKRRLLEQRVIEGAKEQRPQVLRHPWTPEAIRAASPSPIPTNPTEQGLAIVRLFKPRDVVWMGDHYDSGKEWHTANFRTAAQWLKGGRLIGPRICPASFVPGVKSRAKGTVRRVRFLVTEADDLTKPEQGSVIRWLLKCNWRLRAVVDTGGRSLHAWWTMPPAREVAFLTLFLRPFGLDPALANPAQPCRLPGWPRADTGKLPTLIYLRA